MTPTTPLESPWRDMASAPKDGQSVLLGSRTGKWVSEGFYETDERHQGWFQANSHWTDFHDGELQPTHWMPLPEPPK